MNIEFTVDGAVGIVTLNRPDKKNAMLLAMRDGLADLCEQINDRPELRAVVLTGAGTDFCAGADIGEMGGPASAEASYRHARDFQILFARLESLPQPVIAAVSANAFRTDS